MDEIFVYDCCLLIMSMTIYMFDYVMCDFPV
jgi:hypothetical protein